MKELIGPCLPNFRPDSGLPTSSSERLYSHPLKLEGQLPRQRSGQFVGRREFASVMTRENLRGDKPITNVLSLRSMPSFKFSIPASPFRSFLYVLA